MRRCSYSEVGKGAKFKIYLPMVETAHAAETAATQTGLPLGNGELILVVDDKAGIRDIPRMSRVALNKTSNSQMRLFIIVPRREFAMSDRAFNAAAGKAAAANAPT
jgi:hypothetical protein